MKYQLAFFVFFPIILFGQYSNRVLVTINAPFYEGRELMVEPCLSEIHGTAYEEYFIEKAENQKFNVNLVQNGQFSFWVNSHYPVPFYISYFNDSTGEIRFSDIFFVSTTNSQVSIGNLERSGKVSIAQPNPIDKEWSSILNQWKKWDFYERNTLQISKRQKWLTSYIQANPSSYVAMWLVIMDFKNQFTSQEVKKNVTLFSNEIVQLKPFEELIYLSDHQIKLNEVVPFELLSFGPELKAKLKENKWVFVDLWATWCKPCLQQFPELIQLHTTYKNRGIDFMSLTLNPSSESEKVEKVLQSFGATWTNYYAMDQDSKIMASNHIPYGVLIVPDGKVLFMDMKLNDLKVFLTQNVDNKTK